MERDKKVNDAVRKKPKKGEKTNQKEKENDGVVKTNIVELKFLKNKREGKNRTMFYFLKTVIGRKI